ncbi:hypothetical protein FRC06_005567 [Ceratobasidium sp. 370]|nr:hypothetical protein FRC06_005567 [Ceratobasidium sp. 370]
MFSKAPRRTTEEERYKLFFDVHRELLQSHPKSASKHLDIARTKIGLTTFKPSDLSFKACTSIPILPAERTRPGSAAGTETRGDVADQPQASPLPEHAGELPALLPNPEGILSTSRDAAVVLDSTGPVEEGLEDEPRKVGVENDTPMDATGDGPSLPPTPSLVDGASTHSGVSEVDAPSPASLEPSKDPKGPAKTARRARRGSTFCRQYKGKEIPAPIHESSPKIAHRPAGDVGDIQDKGPEEPEQQRKKSVKKAKKAKQRDQHPRIVGQSMRLAFKMSQAIQSKEDIPVETTAELAYSAVDRPSPEAGNALTLTLDPPPDFQPEDQTETIPSPAATHPEPDKAFPSIESSWRPLVYPPPPPGCSRSNPAAPAPIFPPLVAPPRGASLGSGVLPAPPICSPSNVSLPRKSHTVTSASLVEMSDESTRATEPQLEDVPLSATARLGLADKHEDNIRIPVWAVSRQELCELPYFKSMQGGVYMRAHTVYGYLLGRFPSPRDAWRHDGKLIISHGGGKNMMNEDQVQSDDLAAQSKHQLGDDQLETDSSVRGLLTSYRMFRPIVILAEAGYEHLQKFNLKRGRAKEANYYVLGHYAIVAAWAEREEITLQGETSFYTRWKFAFQWIEQDQGPPWWLRASGTPPHIPNPPSIVREYESSNRESFDKKVAPRRFKPLEVVLNPFPSSGTEGKCWTCSAVSPKVYQREWVCLNPDCELFWAFRSCRYNFKEFRTLSSPNTLPGNIRQTIVLSSIAISGLVYVATAVAGSRVGNGGRSGNVPLARYPGGESRVVVYYQLPSDAGQIVHVLNNPAASKAPNELFEQYQKDACDRDMFQRHAIKTHAVKGELYAQHFSFNAGVPYKYIAEAISTPFEECPDSIRSAVEHITYLCKGALETAAEFNELLSVAYAEGQEMNFHSDDEPGLGPVVAGLTLGSSAEMIFRHNIAIKKNLLYKNGPYRASESRTVDVQNERILQITLSHGDLLIMNGAKIQKQFEHAVFVRNSDLLRFAATARNINATNVSNPNTVPLSSQPPRQEPTLNPSQSNYTPRIAHSSNLNFAQLRV